MFAATTVVLTMDSKKLKGPTVREVFFTQSSNKREGN
jgi:hypothetical protein